MNKPYTLCYMMMSVDGRIDCSMLENMPGDEYYQILDDLNVPTTISGRMTAEMELALPGKFAPQSTETLGKEAFFKAADADGYDVMVDTRGTLLWNDSNDYDRPLLILTSESVTKDYLSYLEARHISWIACGKDHVDLSRASEILAEDFGVSRMAVVGGGHINAAFLAAGLLDEVDILIGSGIDGRGGMTAAFDGLPTDQAVTQLTLKDVKTYESGAVWIRYGVKG